MDIINCPVCHFSGTSKEMRSHMKTLEHYFNYYLSQFQVHRGKLCQNRKGAVVTAFINTQTIGYLPGFGQHSVAITYRKGKESNIVMDFRISNNSKRNIYLTRCYSIYPCEYFTIDDYHKFTSTKDPSPLLIRPDLPFLFTVTFKGNANVGTYRMPFCINMQVDVKSTITILREMVVNINGDECNNESFRDDDLIRAIFSGVAWKNIVKRIYPKHKDANAMEYVIPNQYRGPLLAILDPKKVKFLSKEERGIFEYMKEILEGGPILDTYVDFFKILLWLEELRVTMDLKKYNMSNVKFVICESNMGVKRVKLTVPGLAEKRPSLVHGDIVCARFHVPQCPNPPPCIVYMGIICKVENEQIVIDEFDKGFLNSIQHDTRVDVSFSLSRLTYVRQHRALELVAHGIMKKVFPTRNSEIVNVSNLTFYNTIMQENPEQGQAVRNIVANTSGVAPYILFGPPGTGKTVTIVEAILQIVKLKPNCRVLLCAPSNMACDFLAIKLAETMNSNDLIRVHTSNREWATIPKEIKPYSNGSDEGFKLMNIGQLSKYKVIVCTLMHAGKYARPRDSLDDTLNISHVFIDEAGQAKETDCLIPLGGLAKMNTQFVLAGDPKQLGPVVCCPEAESCGFGISLLDRLMNKCCLYNVKSSHRDPTYITKLVKNFRSHPAILKISNEKFYERELQACSEEAKTDSIAQLNILEGHFRNGQAITFHAVSGDDCRLGSSPSYFNLREVETVLQYVKALLSKNSLVKVSPSDIGIISPYIRQTYKIIESLKKHGLYQDIEIGTTEAFQGREKRIMIISTVRGSSELLWYDRKYKLGFVVDQRRFNVALTRAKSKLIVIGNPNCLMAKLKENCWPAYINLCASYKSVAGYVYVKRDGKLQLDVIDRVKHVNLQDVKT